MMLRSFVIALAVSAGLLLLNAHARAETRRIGVVSLVGDRLHLSGSEATTGTKLAAGTTEIIMLKGRELDLAAVRAMVRGVQVAGATAVPLLVNDPTLYETQAGLLAGTELRPPERLASALAAQKATHLVVLLRHRGEARMQADRTQLGTGVVEGLGFYIDRMTSVRLTGTSEQGVGFLAPHVYVRSALIDLGSRRVVTSRVVTASEVIGSPELERGADPWNVLDDQSKLMLLSNMLTKEVEAVTASLLTQ